MRHFYKLLYRSCCFICPVNRIILELILSTIRFWIFCDMLNSKSFPSFEFYSHQFHFDASIRIGQQIYLCTFNRKNIMQFTFLLTV